VERAAWQVAASRRPIAYREGGLCCLGSTGRVGGAVGLSVIFEAASVGLLHHVELWVSDLQRSSPMVWLLTTRGMSLQPWSDGIRFGWAPTYPVLEQSPALRRGST
jgi:hypothetical protein